jgi:hypothetical protein
MKNSTRLAAALLAAFTLAAQIPASAEPANYTILDSYTDGVPTGTSYPLDTYLNQYVDAGSVDASPFVLTRTTTANAYGIVFFRDSTELISGANANTYRLTSTTGAFDFTSFYLQALEMLDLPEFGTDPNPTSVPTMTVTSSAGHTQTFSASVNVMPSFFFPGSYDYTYDSFLVEGTQTLNWSGVRWVDFTTKYTKAKVTTFVLTTAAPLPPPYQAWAQSYGLTGTNTNNTADPDFDGFNNTLEFGFGTPPNAPNAALLGTSVSGANLVVTYLARTTTNEATYGFQSNTKLATPWVADPGIAPTNGPTSPTPPENYTRKQFTVLASSNKFFRIQTSVVNP